MNPGAWYFVPSEDQWYKAAYYKCSGTNAGYWDFPTQSDSSPATVTANTNGIGSSGSSGNFANYNGAASWNGQSGNVTTVGTNGGVGAYGTFDMGGNVWEINDLDGTPTTYRGARVNSYAYSLVSAYDRSNVPSNYEGDGGGFRLAAPAAVPEPSTYCMALAGLACGGYSMFRRRKRA